MIYLFFLHTLIYELKHSIDLTQLMFVRTSTFFWINSVLHGTSFLCIVRGRFFLFGYSCRVMVAPSFSDLVFFVQASASVRSFRYESGQLTKEKTRHLLLPQVFKKEIKWFRHLAFLSTPTVHLPRDTMRTVFNSNYHHSISELVQVMRRSES